MSGDSFTALGLAADPALTDDDVRAAWRRAAAATHPDRADGGDPAAFAAAAAAYSDLRTAFGRGEALADLAAAATLSPPARVRRPREPLGGWVRRIGRGRPARLAGRLAAVTAVSVLVVTVNGWRPASLALVAGALTWLIRSARRDIAPAARRPPDADAPSQ
jgi:curved DNA-binding protein CbpA